MNKSTIWLLCLLTQYVVVMATDVIYGYEDPDRNLIQNWSFEEGQSQWNTRLAEVTDMNWGHTGSKSVKVSNRLHQDGGVYQKFYDIPKNTNYYLSVFIKLLRNTTSGTYINVRTFARCAKTTGGVQNMNVGTLPFELADRAWEQIGGDFNTGDLDCKRHEFFIRVSPVDVPYLVDSVSLIEVETRDDWNTYLDDKIAENRKSQLTISGSLPGDYDPTQTSIQVELKRHEFGFGASIKAAKYNGGQERDVNYKQFIHDHFNWAVFENDMKWKPMEKSRGSIKFGAVDQAMEDLQSLNFTFRGHALVWDIKDNNPTFVQNKNGTVLEAESDRRITYMMDHFRGRVSEWDVSNEFFHGHFFEDETDILDIMEHQFELAHSLDPSADLFTNDYQILRTGEMASAHANLALRLLSENIPIHGIGIQSHLRDTPIEPEILELRLAIVAAAGLPITITELSVHNDDIAIRADMVELAFKIYFAQPKVRAVVIWDFTEQYNPFADDMFLTDGTDFTPNAAGQKMLDLIHVEWHTDVTLTPASSALAETLSVFRGNYEMTVSHPGKDDYVQQFYVGAGDTSVTLTL